MRLDVFLKISRLIKRRAVAQGMCDAGGVLVNGYRAKPAKQVRPGDRITIKLPSRVIELEIVRTGEKGKIAAGDLYKVKSETRVPKGNGVWSENL